MPLACGGTVCQRKGVYQGVRLLVAREQGDSKKPESQLILQGQAI